ncbi:hypothetical protein SESBI_18216 [Sesbania bispinosa]|nr:hypothetical protein SESBI_18216 [Sesbania bispinosa]
MKVSGFCALFLVVGTALALFNFLSSTGVSWFPDLVATSCGDKITLIAVSRKLKVWMLLKIHMDFSSEENGSSIRSNNKGDIGHVSLDDYRPIDPSPSSKASLDPGPIEHGTPLNPYIPNPSRPSPPRFGDSD